MTEQRLIAVLEQHATVSGLALVRSDALAATLETTPELVLAALDKLTAADVIEVLTPGRFLVIRLRTWPGREPEPAKTAPKTGAAQHHAYGYPKLLHNRLNNSYRPDPQVAGSTSGLLKEILETLGETEAASFTKAVELYSPKVIRTALARVRRAEHIRTSRTALFRHLLPILAKESRN